MAVKGHQTPVCKFYLEGRCLRGEFCHFRHTGHPIPLATAIRQPETVPAFAPGTVTVMVGAMSTTVTDGVIPVHIDLAPTQTGLPRLHSLETTLRVTWYKSSRAVWMSYRDEAMAEEAYSCLSKKLRHVCLEIQLQRHHIPRISTVKIFSLETSVSKTDLLSVLPELLHPDDPITFGPHNYDASVSGEDAIRRRILESTGCQILSEIPLEKLSPSKACREFLFTDNPGVEGLVEELHDKPFKELGECKIYVQPLMVVKLHVKKEAYGAKCQELKTVFSDIATRYQVRHKIEVVKDGILIALCSENRNRLAHAKDRVEIVFKKPEWLYHPSKTPSKQTHRIRLTKAKAYQEAKRALEQIKGSFAAGVISFDEESDPPAILVNGDANTMRKLVKIMRPDKALPKSKTAACIICLDDSVDEFVKMDGCGHTACTDCLLTYCTIEREGKFPLTCFGEGCTQNIPLPKVESLLSQEQMVHLCQEAVIDHYRRHPADYGSCPGKGCGKVYRKSGKKNQRNTCGNCLICLCAHCNVAYHDGESCEDYQKRLAEAEHETARWMEEVGAKKCPKCKTVMWKEEDSCNNVQCRVCRTHFCWICFDIQKTHAEVYQHLSQSHGGFFDDEIRAWNNTLNDLAPGEAAINGLIDADAVIEDQIRRLHLEARALREVHANAAEPYRRHRRHRHEGFLLPDEQAENRDEAEAAQEARVDRPFGVPQGFMRAEEAPAAAGAERNRQHIPDRLLAGEDFWGVRALQGGEQPGQMGAGAGLRLAIRPVDGPAHHPLPQLERGFWEDADDGVPFDFPPPARRMLPQQGFVPALNQARGQLREAERARRPQRRALIAADFEDLLLRQEPRPGRAEQQQGFVPANDGGIRAEIGFNEDHGLALRRQPAERREPIPAPAQALLEGRQPAGEQQQGFVFAGFHEHRGQ